MIFERFEEMGLLRFRHKVIEGMKKMAKNGLKLCFFYFIWKSPSAYASDITAKATRKSYNPAEIAT